MGQIGTEQSHGKWEKHVRLFAGLGAVGQIHRREEVNQLFGRASLLQHESRQVSLSRWAPAAKKKGKGKKKEKKKETKRTLKKVSRRWSCRLTSMVSLEKSSLVEAFITISPRLLGSVSPLKRVTLRSAGALVDGCGEVEAGGVFDFFFSSS